MGLLYSAMERKRINDPAYLQWKMHFGNEKDHISHQNVWNQVVYSPCRVSPLRDEPHLERIFPQTFL